MDTESPRAGVPERRHMVSPVIDHHPGPHDHGESEPGRNWPQVHELRPRGKLAGPRAQSDTREHVAEDEEPWPARIVSIRRIIRSNCPDQALPSPERFR